MALQSTDIADMIVTTMAHRVYNKWTDIAAEYTKCFFLPEIMKDKKITYQSGTSITDTLMTEYSDSAKDEGLMETRTYGDQDVMGEIDIPWRNTNTHWIFEDHLVSQNSRYPERIVDIMKTKEVAAIGGLTEHFEVRGWTKPASSDDTVRPYGVQMYIVKNGTLGFHGGDPAGFSSGVGGLTVAAKPKWSNYSGAFTLYSEDDFINKAFRMALETDFKSYVGEPTAARGDQGVAYYTNLEGFLAIKQLLAKRNDNIRITDLEYSTKEGLTFGGKPIHRVPYLTNDTSNPFYQIDWKWFRPIFQTGWFMKRGQPIRLPYQPNVHVIPIDNTWNLSCTNRRAQGVLYQA